jgi:hypothetical protein
MLWFWAGFLAYWPHSKEAYAMFDCPSRNVQRTSTSGLGLQSPQRKISLNQT